MCRSLQQGGLLIKSRSGKKKMPAEWLSMWRSWGTSEIPLICSKKVWMYQMSLQGRVLSESGYWQFVLAHYHNVCESIYFLSVNVEVFLECSQLEYHYTLWHHVRCALENLSTLQAQLQHLERKIPDPRLEDLWDRGLRRQVSTFLCMKGRTQWAQLNLFAIIDRSWPCARNSFAGMMCYAWHTMENLFWLLAIIMVVLLFGTCLTQPRYAPSTSTVDLFSRP